MRLAELLELPERLPIIRLRFLPLGLKGLHGLLRNRIVELEIERNRVPRRGNRSEQQSTARNLMASISTTDGTGDAERLEGLASCRCRGGTHESSVQTLSSYERSTRPAELLTEGGSRERECEWRRTGRDRACRGA